MACSGKNARIRAHGSTLRKLLDGGARVALVSHFGRPKGASDPLLSLKQIVPDVERAYGVKVLFVDDCVGPKVQAALDALSKGEVALLENVRFHPEEQKNVGSLLHPSYRLLMQPRSCSLGITLLL